MKNSLILVRHGETDYNVTRQFTGWTDVSINKKGQKQAKSTGEIISKNNLKFDVVYTSYLIRSQETANILLKTANITDADVRSDWRINERNFGILEGLTNDEAEIKYGVENISNIKLDYHLKAPEYDINTKKDKKYEGITIPSPESNEDCFLRICEFYNNSIIPLLEQGKKVMLVGHGKTLLLLLLRLYGMDPDKPHNLNKIDNCVLYGFDFLDGEIKTPHRKIT